jgi:hypothetical protein
MGYGDSTVRMSATANARSLGTTGTTDGESMFNADFGRAILSLASGGNSDKKAFYKNGEERKRLKELMARFGNEVEALKPEDIIREDPYFEQFQVNSIKSNMTMIKKELRERKGK